MADAPTFQPKGLAAATLGVSIALCIISTATVFLRIWVRWGNKAQGLDDYLMVVGWAIFIACATFTCMACYNGLGTPDDVIMAASDPAQMIMNAYKYFFFFQVTYVWTLPFIKASICVALLRITTARRYRYPLWTIMVISTGTAFAGFVGALMNCRPIAAGWDSSLGTCDTTGTIQTLSEVISAAAIVTDWACAILPAFLIWGLNMKQKQKITLCGILAVGVVASVSTIVRFPNLRFYAIPEDQLMHFGDVVLWTIVECGLGITAGSLPSLRPLLRKVGFSSNKSDNKYRLEPSKPGGRSIQLDTLRGHSTATCQGKEDHWDRVDDNSSQKFIIMKNTQVDVEWSAQSAKDHEVREHISVSDGKSL
ncbi:hypothetical protein BJ170DRAFT_611588 [Xylariales sp. AK1849]|nr:hypothetical protein BJ170DRAFT_611588 [Xylariales sp. AK1849]